MAAGEAGVNLANKSAHDRSRRRGQIRRGSTASPVADHRSRRPRPREHRGILGTTYPTKTATAPREFPFPLPHTLYSRREAEVGSPSICMIPGAIKQRDPAHTRLTAEALPMPASVPVVGWKEGRLPGGVRSAHLGACERPASIQDPFTRCQVGDVRVVESQSPGIQPAGSQNIVMN